MFQNEDQNEALVAPGRGLREALKPAGRSARLKMPESKKQSL